MAYIAPSTRSAGSLITAAVWNQDVVANPAAIYAGAMAVPTQANGRFLVASSASQLSANRNAFVKNFMEAMT